MCPHTSAGEGGLCSHALLMCRHTTAGEGGAEGNAAAGNKDSSCSSSSNTCSSIPPQSSSKREKEKETRAASSSTSNMGYVPYASLKRTGQSLLQKLTKQDAERQQRIILQVYLRCCVGVCVCVRE